MSDEDIREFSRTQTGSPITKIELDTLNVALASNGGKVYIDDVLQVASPINDGRRAHIALSGDVLDVDIPLIPNGFDISDHFLGTDYSPYWDLTLGGGNSYSVSDSFFKMTMGGSFGGNLKANDFHIPGGSTSFVETYSYIKTATYDYIPVICYQDGRIQEQVRIESGTPNTIKFYDLNNFPGGVVLLSNFPLNIDDKIYTKIAHTGTTSTITVEINDINVVTHPIITTTWDLGIKTGFFFFNDVQTIWFDQIVASSI